MKKLKVIAIMLCFAAVGLAVSCSKDEKKEDATLVGKWKCIYALVENYDYRSAGSVIKIDTNITYDEARIGKSWEFTEDGFFRREGEQRVNYTVNGDLLTFRRIDPPQDTLGFMKIIELHEKWVQLYNESDSRGSNGQGTVTKNTYVLSKTLEQ